MSQQEKMQTIPYLAFMGIHGSLALFDLMVVVFLCREWTKPKSVLASSYFIILNYGYIVDIIFTVFWIYGHLVFYSPDNPLTPVVIITQWYAQLALGLWNVMLGFNRCTALAYPIAHKKIWNWKTILACIILLILYPFIIDGYSFRDPSCKLKYFDSPECAYLKTRTHYTIAISNVACGIFCLGIIIFGVIKSPKQKNQTKQIKMERNLIIQTFFFSTFLIAIFMTDLCALYYQSLIIHTLSYGCYIIQFYAAIIILFFISPCFRRGFVKFYYFDKCFATRQTAQSITVRNFHSLT